MAGVIKKLYHPIDNGTVTTAVSQELQEVYPITATSAVYAPAEAPAEIRGKNLEQILNLKQNLLVSGQNIKTINGNSLLGDGDLTIGGGGGGSSTLDQYLGFDAENNAVYVKGNYGFYSNSFISAGGVGSGGGGGQGGDGNATSIMGVPISFNNLDNGQTIYYDSSANRWKNANIYRTISVKRANWDPLNPTQNIVTVLNGYHRDSLFLQEGTGVTFDVDATSGTIKINASGGTGSLPRAGSGLQYGTGANADVLSVKLGSGLGIDNNGAVYLPTASSSTKGGVKIGTDLSMSGEVLSVDRSSLKGYLDGYFVHLTGPESVNGLKTFVDGIAIGNNTKTITLVNGEIVINGDVKVNGNFYATGNVTAGTSSN